MSVIIRLQNLPWSANALDIRNFFRGLSIPEGGVHIVGGELGDAFIAFSTGTYDEVGRILEILETDIGFSTELGTHLHINTFVGGADADNHTISTDEDARQAMMLNGGKIKEIQVSLLLSSRSEMHKVIETARQTVPILTLTAPAPAPIAPPVIPPPVTQTPQPATIPSPFSTALSNSLSSFGIPGIGNPQEIPQPAVIEPPAPLISPPIITTPEDPESLDNYERKRSKDKDRRRSRTRSRSKDRSERKDRKRDRRDRSRSRDRRRRDRSRSRDRRDRKRDRKERSSRSRERSPSRRSRDRRPNDRNNPQIDSRSQSYDPSGEPPVAPAPPPFGPPNVTPMTQANLMPNLPLNQMGPIDPPRFNSDPSMADAFNKLQELGKKRNPNAFQGDNQRERRLEDQNGGGRMQHHSGRGGGNMGRGGANFRRDREGRSRFDNNEQQKDCCVAIRNAPNHTSYGDVRRFFPFMIDKHGIKMINDNMGRRTGNIFVRFCDPRSKHLALQRKNNELKGAEVIVEALDDGAYESAVDSFLPYRDDNGAEEPHIMIPEPEEIAQPSFTVIKLTDLPHFVKEHDIIKTFSDFSLLSITLNDDRATRTKIAFVQFAKPEDAKTVLEQKDRYMFGRRRPTMAACLNDEHEREKILQNERIQQDRQRDEPINEPRSDPRNGPREDIEPEQPPLQEREPDAPRDPRQRRPPFDNAAPHNAPMQQQQPAFFGTPFAQAQFAVPFGTAPAPFGGFPAGGLDPRTAAANWANRPNFPNQMGGPLPSHKNHTPDLENEPLDCVLMKGLPRDATDRTIVTFLSDTGAVPARIHLMLDPNGMPSGDCFCEFRSTQEARMATIKHGQNLDGCRITVDLVTRSVVEDALEGPKQPEMREGLLGPNLSQQTPFFDGPRGGGFGARGGYRGRGGFDRGFDRGGYRGGFDSGRGGFDSSRGGYDGGRRGFDNGGRGDFDNGGRGGFDNGGRGGYRGRGGFGERGGRGFDRGRGRGFGRGRGGFENGRLDRGSDMPEEPDNGLEDFGAPGCVVAMENVPFRASVDEIMEFFSDFELTQDDVIRRYNERGQPTGDARVAFRTPFDAQRAIKTRHMDTIHDRRITLKML